MYCAGSLNRRMAGKDCYVKSTAFISTRTKPTAPEQKYRIVFIIISSITSIPIMATVSEASGSAQKGGWRGLITTMHEDRMERSKNMHHYPPRKRKDGALVLEIFGKLSAMADEAPNPADAGGSSADTRKPPRPPQQQQPKPSPAPLQTLVISGREQREQLEQADRATEQYQQLDSDFLRGDWMARILYGCTSDNPAHDVREMAWRYTQLDFLCRFVWDLDEYAYCKKPRDERVCCGALDPRIRFDLFQILRPENWNAAHGCHYTDWQQFEADYNSWGTGVGPQPSWLPAVPGTSKKAAEDVVVAYLITCVGPICQWFFGPGGPPLHNRLLTEQFMMRGVPSLGMESVSAMTRRCIRGEHDPHTGFYDVALRMWADYASYVPGVVELSLQQHDISDSTQWVTPSAQARR